MSVRPAPPGYRRVRRQPPARRRAPPRGGLDVFRRSAASSSRSTRRASAAEPRPRARPARVQAPMPLTAPAALCKTASAEAAPRPRPASNRRRSPSRCAPTAQRRRARAEAWRATCGAARDAAPNHARGGIPELQGASGCVRATPPPRGRARAHRRQPPSQLPRGALSVPATVPGCEQALQGLEGEGAAPAPPSAPRTRARAVAPAKSARGSRACCARNALRQPRVAQARALPCRDLPAPSASCAPGEARHRLRAAGRRRGPPCLPSWMRDASLRAAVSRCASCAHARHCSELREYADWSSRRRTSSWPQLLGSTLAACQSFALVATADSSLSLVISHDKAWCSVASGGGGS